MSQAITAEDLRQCTVELVFHINMGNGGFVLNQRCVEHPSLIIIQERKSQKAKLYRTYQVGDHQCDTLEGAAKLLTQQRDDLEWEAAAPDVIGKDARP